MSFVQAGFGWTASGSSSNVATTGVGDTGLPSNVTLGNVLAVCFGFRSGNTYYVPSITFTGTATLTPIVSTGAILTMGTPSGGVAAAGTYANKALSGGSGSGATFSATVTGTSITAFAIQCGAMGYNVGDTLTFPGTLIGGSGTWSVTVSTISAGVIDFITDTATNTNLYHFAYNITASGPCQVVATVGQTFQTPSVAAVELSGIASLPSGQVQHTATAQTFATGGAITTANIACASAPALLCAWGWSCNASGIAPTAGGGATVNATGWKGISTSGTQVTLAFETLAISSAAATPVTFTSADAFAGDYLMGAIFTGVTSGPSFTPGGGAGALAGLASRLGAGITPHTA